MPFLKLSLRPSRHAAEPHPPSFAHPSWFSIVTPILVGVATNSITDLQKTDPTRFILAVTVLCGASLLADFAGRYVAYLMKHKAWIERRARKDDELSGKK